jgi:hypothetical protein
MSKVRQPGRIAPAEKRPISIASVSSPNGLDFYDAELRAQHEHLGLGGTFRGHDGLVKVIDAFDEAWERREMLPVLVLDLGDRWLTLGRLRVPGTVSGLEFEPEIAQLLTIEGGLIAHERDFLSWDRGLRAAGLDPESIALP